MLDLKGLELRSKIDSYLGDLIDSKTMVIYYAPAKTTII